MSNYMLEAALAYARMGWKVFPCKVDKVDLSKDKTPLTPNGHNDATTDEKQIRQWWTQWPGAQIAFALPPNIVVVDVDIMPEKGKHGDQTMLEWWEQYGLFPDTVRAVTGSGGWHFYFTLDRPPLHCDNNFMQAVDIKTTGGYVILPPSPHSSDNCYAWEDGHSPDDIEMEPLPDALYDQFMAKKAPASSFELPAELVEGQRNDTLFKDACSLREKGHTQAEITATLYQVNKDRCKPPLPEKEVDKIIKSACKYKRGELATGSAGGKQQSSKIEIPELKLVKASDVPYAPPNWLLRPYFQLGRVTVLQADPGTGKTSVMCDFAAHVSTGLSLVVGGIVIPVEVSGNVLLLSSEDDRPILRGRLEVNGADLDKCFLPEKISGITFTSPQIEEMIKLYQAKMVIFDPYQAFIGSDVDMNKSNQTRPILINLFEMAERNNCAVVIIAHVSKGSNGAAAVTRSLGSVDLPAASRSVLHLERNPDDENEVIMFHVKSNNAPKGHNLAFTIGDRGLITWTGISDLTNTNLKTIQRRKERGVPYEDEPLVKVFKHLIEQRPAGGFWSYAEAQEEGAKVLGFPPWANSRDLIQRLDSSLLRELQERDGLIVTCGHKSNGPRGFKIERYKLEIGNLNEVLPEGW